MSARDKLYEAMASGWSLTHAEAANLYRVVDDVLSVHAHELAEEIRKQTARGNLIRPEHEDAWEAGLDCAADLIDPLDETGKPKAGEETP